MADSNRGLPEADEAGVAWSRKSRKKGPSRGQMVRVVFRDESVGRAKRRVVEKRNSWRSTVCLQEGAYNPKAKNDVLDDARHNL